MNILNQDPELLNKVVAIINHIANNNAAKLDDVLVQGSTSERLAKELGYYFITANYSLRRRIAGYYLKPTTSKEAVLKALNKSTVTSIITKCPALSNLGTVYNKFHYDIKFNNSKFTIKPNQFNLAQLSAIFTKSTKKLTGRRTLDYIDQLAALPYESIIDDYFAMIIANGTITKTAARTIVNSPSTKYLAAMHSDSYVTLADVMNLHILPAKFYYSSNTLHNYVVGSTEPIEPTDVPIYVAHCTILNNLLLPKHKNLRHSSDKAIADLRDTILAQLNKPDVLPYVTEYINTCQTQATNLFNLLE